MKISIDYPPLYQAIKEVLPNHGKSIFCHGDTIYNPYNLEITEDLKVHEAVHQKQQGDNPNLWWSNYLSDKDFRLQQEIEAYGTQYAWVKKLDMKWVIKDWMKEKMAQALSGESYGNLISYAEAESKIRNYAKSI